jgi:hypothetical protein
VARLPKLGSQVAQRSSRANDRDLIVWRELHDSRYPAQVNSGSFNALIDGWLAANRLMRIGRPHVRRRPDEVLDVFERLRRIGTHHAAPRHRFRCSMHPF